jgi:putative peptidoglycan lipid II flippase
MRRAVYTDCLTRQLHRFLSRLPKGSLVLAIVSTANVALGFAREATVAYFFGTSVELDTFLMALALPKLLAVTFAQLTVAVVLPLYVGHRQAGQRELASALVQKWFWFSGAVIAVLCAILFVGADFLMSAMAPGFSPAHRAEAAGWLRTLLPYVWLLGVAGTFTVVLNSNDRFFVPAVSSELISASVIVACVAAAQVLGVGSLAAGFVAGGMLGFTWQLLNSRRFEPALPSLGTPHLNVTLPIAASGAMAFHYASKQLDTVVDRAFASGLPHGSIAAYNYAQMINGIPSAIVTAAVATALFPVLSRMAATGDFRAALRTARRWSAALCLLILGPALLLAFFRSQVVTLAFERGAFDANGVRMTAEVLMVTPFVILFQVVLVLFSLLLFAQKRHRVVAALSVLFVSSKVVLSSWLVNTHGLLGLAFATLIATGLSTSLTVYWAHNRTPRHREAGQ